MNEFYTGLFDYCFDHNYQQKMLEKLEELDQGNKNVQEYVHEFEETAQQVGMLSASDKVNRLFRGFKLGIQGDLYFRGVTPLHSTWDTVVEEALLVEAAHRARTGAFKSRRCNLRRFDQLPNHLNTPPRVRCNLVKEKNRHPLNHNQKEELPQELG